MVIIIGIFIVNFIVKNKYEVFLKIEILKKFCILVVFLWIFIVGFWILWFVNLFDNELFGCVLFKNRLLDFLLLIKLCVDFLLYFIIIIIFVLL